MSLSEADRVWNRAAVEGGGAKPGPADSHLAALLLVDSMIMNGGPSHAADVCSDEDWTVAIDACHYFGLDLLVPLLQRIRAYPTAGDASGDLDLELTYAYCALEPGIQRAFTRMFQSSRAEFAPLLIDGMQELFWQKVQPLALIGKVKIHEPADWVSDIILTRAAGGAHLSMAADLLGQHPGVMDLLADGLLAEAFVALVSHGRWLHAPASFWQEINAAADVLHLEELREPEAVIPSVGGAVREARERAGR